MSHDNEEFVISELILYLSKIQPEELAYNSAREIVNRFFMEREQIAQEQTAYPESFILTNK